nr:splicing factor PWI domain containing protein [Paspalum simplex]
MGMKQWQCTGSPTKLLKEDALHLGDAGELEYWRGRTSALAHPAHCRWPPALGGSLSRGQALGRGRWKSSCFLPSMRCLTPGKALSQELSSPRWWERMALPVFGPNVGPRALPEAYLKHITWVPQLPRQHAKLGSLQDPWKLERPKPEGLGLGSNPSQEVVNRYLWQRNPWKSISFT